MLLLLLLMMMLMLMLMMMLISIIGIICGSAVNKRSRWCCCCSCYRIYCLRYIKRRWWRCVRCRKMHWLLPVQWCVSFVWRLVYGLCWVKKVFVIFSHISVRWWNCWRSLTYRICATFNRLRWLSKHIGYIVTTTTICHMTILYHYMWWSRANCSR